MDTVLILASIAVVHLLAVASPGPTLAVVTSYAVGGDRRSGALVTLGVLLATLTWSSLAAAGLGTVIAHFSWAYVVLQLAGAAYLIYLGIKMLISATRNHPTPASHAPPLPAPGRPAVRAGFLTNITNPKTIAYYASLFGVMIPLDAPSWLFAAAVGTGHLGRMVAVGHVVLLTRPHHAGLCAGSPQARHPDGRPLDLPRRAAGPLALNKIRLGSTHLLRRKIGPDSWPPTGAVLKFQGKDHGFRCDGR